MSFADTPTQIPSAKQGCLTNHPQSYLLISGDFVRTGGMDIANYHLADFLARQGVPVHLVSHGVDAGLLAYPNVQWHRAARPFGVHLLGEHFLRYLGRHSADNKLLAEGGILVNGGNCPLPAANWVHYLHAAAPPNSGTHGWRKWKNRLARRLSLRDEAEALRCARIIIVNSNRTRKDVIEHYGVREDLIRVVYYGSDSRQFHPIEDPARQTLRSALGLSPEKFLIAFVGALGDRRKGFDTLFEAWQMMDPKLREKVELVVVGRGAELPLWKKRAVELPAGGSIRFLGFRRDVPEILKACDAFIAPTRYEAFGLAAQEALCCGLPVIVSRDAGVAELFSPSLDDLLLDDFEDAAELTAKLQLLYAGRVAFRKAAIQLSATLRTYAWDDMARSIQTLLVG
jgi:glycosyltransferase involved in cell wall biosynthesis